MQKIYLKNMKIQKKKYNLKIFLLINLKDKN